MSLGDGPHTVEQIINDGTDQDRLELLRTVLGSIPKDQFYPIVLEAMHRESLKPERSKSSNQEVYIRQPRRPALVVHHSDDEGPKTPVEARHITSHVSQPPVVHQTLSASHGSNDVHCGGKSFLLITY